MFLNPDKTFGLHAHLHLFTRCPTIDYSADLSFDINNSLVLSHYRLKRGSKPTASTSLSNSHHITSAKTPPGVLKRLQGLSI